MSSRRLFTSPVGTGAKVLLRGRPVSPVWRNSIPVRTAAVRSAAFPTVRFANRSFSSQKPATPAGQASRFKKPSASPAEPSTGAAREELPHSPSLKANATEPVAASKPPAPEPVAYATPAHSYSPRPQAQVPKPANTSSKEYKRAARKVTSVMVALPILLVTSYYLFERGT